ncbi:acyl carrier protein [Streptomyces sp. NBC_01231]|nr:acyl carrier protein [Streptomyces sp. NBC_01231]
MRRASSIRRADLTGSTWGRLVRQVHDTEKAIKPWVVSVVEEALRAGPVTPTDSFHDFGGSSLTAMRICIRIHKETGVEITPEALLDSDTIGQFADEVAARINS